VDYWRESDVMISQRQVGFWLAVLVVIVLAVYLLSGVIMPFAAGLALGYLLDPIVGRLERLGLGRLGATLLILALFLCAFSTIIILLLPVLGHQLSGFIDKLPTYAVQLQSLFADEGGKLSDFFGADVLNWLGISGGVSPADVQKSISEFAGQGAQWLGTFLRSLWSGGAAIVSLASLVVVTPVVAFYILLDWSRMIATIDSWIPIPHRPAVRNVAREVDKALSGFVRGQSLVCLFLGLWYGVGLSLIGLNFGFLIGFSAGVLSFIPYVGSLSALVLSIAVALVQGWPSLKLLALALAVVITGQFLEGNVLSPKLVGASVGLHPVWLMFALFAFGSLFGFTGLIIAVPLAATVGVLARFGLRKYLASPIYRGESDSQAPGTGT
jgi:predicted PurR-regulated permease PerM